MSLSALDREQYLNQLGSETFDILVVGGGITGAGIALDAASRGLKVALVEKGDFACGTSSRSTKLIHGGLRYLKQLEFGIVRETGQERAILYKNAPHIVYPEKMLLPIIKGGSLGKKSTSLGLLVYDLLAGVERKERRYMLDKTETLKAEPLLREEILKGGGMYIEYRSDDARLVIEVLKSAKNLGALIINYAKVSELKYDEKGQVSGAKVLDERNGRTVEVNALKVINAAGPWVDNLRQADKSLKNKRLHLTKGVHIVVSKEKLPIQQAVYFDVPADKRMVFAIPRNEVVYVGTTDTTYKGSTDECFATKEDVEYILSAANYIFPTVKLKPSDVVSTWAGLRPLIHEDGKSPSDLSRKDEIFISDSGLISMAGGKLTGFRKMAERAVDTALKQLSTSHGYTFKPCVTAKLSISGGDIQGYPSVGAYETALVTEYPKFPGKEIMSLVRKYGSNARKILDAATEKEGCDKLLKSEVAYAINEEMCYTLSDFIVRRSGRMYFERPSLQSIYPVIQNQFTETLHLSSEQAAADLKEFMKEYYGVMAFCEKNLAKVDLA